MELLFLFSIPYIIMNFNMIFDNYILPMIVEK